MRKGSSNEIKKKVIEGITKVFSEIDISAKKVSRDS